MHRRPLVHAALALACASCVALAAPDPGGVKLPDNPRVGSASLPRPTQPADGVAVTIYRDAMGVPHVYAATSAAVMYGAGYALTEDRLAQMEKSRWEAAGRLAELIGPQGLANDRSRRLGGYTDPQLQAMFRRLAPEYQAMMRAYVAGVNARIREVNADPAAKLPYEFKEWGIPLRPWTLDEYLRTVILPLSGGGTEIINLAFLNYLTDRYGAATARTLFDDVLPLNDPDAPPAIPPEENRAEALRRAPYQPAGPNQSHVTALQFAMRAPPSPPPKPHQDTSRCLMIGPQRSANGHVMMLQGTSDGPDIVLNGGGFDTAGFSAFGDTVIGMPVMGRGPHHGWLLTAGEIDTGDTYAERLNPHNRYQYWYRGAWRTMTRRIETLQVKGGSPVELEVVRSVHGLVTAWDPTHNVAFSRREAAERDNALSIWVGYIDMGRARNRVEFEKAISGIDLSMGVCYGNEAGHLAFWEIGRVPLRAPGVDPRLPTPGTGEYEWSGIVPASQMPHLRDPKLGFFHTWNSTPTREWISGESGRYGKTFRTDFGIRLVQSHARPLSMDDMRAINRKIVTSFAGQDLTVSDPRFFVPYLRRAVATTNDSRLREAVEAIESWNGFYEDLDGDGDYDNIGATIFRTWLTTAQAMILGDDIGEWWHGIDDAKYIKYRTSLLLRIIQRSDAALPVKFDFFNGHDPDAVLRDTLIRTLDGLTARYGSPQIASWRQPVFWEFYDPAERDRHPEKPELPSGLREPLTPRTAARLGLIPAMEPNNGAEGWSGLMEIGPATHVLEDVTKSGGQSLFIDQQGRGNPHLGDQIQMYLETRLKTVEMERAAVAAKAESTRELVMPAAAIAAPRQ